MVVVFSKSVYVYILIGLCIWVAVSSSSSSSDNSWWYNLAELVWCIFAWPMVIVVPVFRYAMVFFSNRIYWTLLSNQFV